MKLIAPYLFILLVFVYSFNNNIILLQFEMNKTYIANNLCENRSKPAMHCNGKCQLMKKMKQEENNGNNTGNNSKNNISIQETLITETFLIIPPSIEKEISLINHTPGSTSSYNASVFHPPCI